MKERVANLLGPSARWTWVSTFHASCARMLRQDAPLLGYKTSFTIYDEDDSTRLVRHCLEDLRLDPKRYAPKALRGVISDAKNKLIDVDDFARGGGGAGGTAWDDEGGAYEDERFHDITAAVYKRYQARLLEANALDFDDLLMRTVDVLQLFPERLAYYRDLFRHVLVDEYQDTNRAQYMLVKLLTEEHRQVTVVGDDDQSVYSWRGADIRNILSFEDDFPDASVVKLEQNYRSYTTILDAANALVAHNRGRKPKNLWTERGAGEPVNVLECCDEHEEARLVCEEIVRQIKIRPASDLAVFYRVNAQSRVIEDMLVRQGIGYRVIGGTKFYQRAEIKDLLAYLRVTLNASDDISLLRVINTPRRGLGDVAIGRLQMFGQENGVSLRGSLLHAEEAGLSGAATSACTRLGEDFASWEAESGKVATIVRKVLTESGLVVRPQGRAHSGSRRAPGEPGGVRRCGPGIRPSEPRGVAGRFLAGDQSLRRHRQPGGERTSRDSHDPPQRQGTGVPRGVPHRDGGGPLPAFAVAGRTASGGRTAALLCGHHPRSGHPVPVVRPFAHPARQRRLQTAQPVPERDPRAVQEVPHWAGRRAPGRRSSGETGPARRRRAVTQPHSAKRYLPALSRRATRCFTRSSGRASCSAWSRAESSASSSPTAAIRSAFCLSTRR